MLKLLRMILQFSQTKNHKYELESFKNGKRL